MSKILVLGIGNDILTDDGIGPRLVSELRNEMDSNLLDFMTMASGGLEILEIIKDYKQVIIVDAIKTEGGVPGDIYYLTPSNFKETLHISSFHDVSFLTSLKLADKLDMAVPEQIDIIAIEILEDLTFSSAFSKPIADLYSSIYEKVKGKIMDLTSGK